MKLLKNKQQKSHWNRNICCIFKDNIKINTTKIQNIAKLGTIVMIQGNIEMLHITSNNLKYSIPKEIPIVFHNGSNYDYHFIRKELPEEFKGQFTCLGENTKKYITFSLPIEKKL